MMAKPKKKIKKHRRGSIMNRSDIPYAERMAMQHRGAIIANREHAAKTIMYCVCCALHKSEGIGYKRLVRYSIRFKTVLDAETFWEMLSRWTDSVFEFFVPGDNDDKQPEYAFKTDNPGLQEIYNSVVELGITEPVVPMWVPQEYVLEELFVLEEPSESSICAIMKGHENELIISIAVQSAHAPLNHMKDTQNVEVLERDGIEHYIISNNEQVIATWATKNIECSVVMDCQEDIYRILNSVYTTEVQ